MIIQDLTTLKIHKLTQEQYERELEAGRIDENALYLTPDNSITVWQPNTEYKVDDVVIADSILLGYKAYPETAVLKCGKKHTSSADPIKEGVYWDVVFTISANKSFSDHEGNIITETYATKEELEEALENIPTKTDMVNDVLAALPTWNGGSY